VTWPFGGLRMFGYRKILIDCPWDFDGGGDRNARNHYPCMSPDELAAMPVGDLAAGDCALFMWVTDPFLEEGIRVMKAWGFRYVSVAFYFVKLNKRAPSYFMGTGYGTRANPEPCLLGMVGDMGLPLNRDVRRLIVEPIREHSRKPDRVNGDIDRLYAGAAVELFARRRVPGWDSWGNEVDRFDA
jgi:N6-adenosine-specific RNA methylase IME4